MPPGKIALFRDRVDSILASLRQSPVTDDELRRAKQPIVQRRIKQMQAAAYWLNVLTAEALTPPVQDMLRSRVSGLDAVTAAEVRDVVARFLSGPPLAIEVTAAK